MKKWPTVDVTLGGEKQSIQSPLIISASRATDIPACYGEWLVKRFQSGLLLWQNPFSGKEQLLSLKDVRLIVFWSKNPAPFLETLPFFITKKIGIYFQYTLNDYEKEGLEPGIPALEKRIETFIRLSKIIGRDHLAWRFDPMLLCATLEKEELLERIISIGDQIAPYTDRLIFSFIKIERYKQVCRNITKGAPGIRELKQDEKHFILSGLSLHAGQHWDLEISSCGEADDYSEYGIDAPGCIDYRRLVRLFSHDSTLMDFLEYQPSLFESGETIKMPAKLKAQGQQPGCHCTMSKDIGFYSSCPHGCVYCYANRTPAMGIRRYNEIIREEEEVWKKR